MFNKVPSNSQTDPPGAANQGSSKQGSPKLPFYRVLWVQVSLAMVAAVVLGYLDPARAPKPLRTL